MTQTAHAITIAGSVATVTEYLGFAINNILFQRGVYPADSFHQVRRYGLPLMISTDEDLNRYLGELLQQIANWLAGGECRYVVLLLTDPATEYVHERWEFELVGQAAAYGAVPKRRKTEEEVRAEIQTVMRQITASVSFLPEMPSPCSFDLLVYTNPSTAVPSEAWEISTPHLLERGKEVRLRTISTGYHKVGTTVAYRA